MKIIIVFVISLFSVFIFHNQTLAQIGVDVTIAPPEIPEYVQPVCPYDGYIWTPGYWAYDPDGYYWVPGFWAAPPTIGFLWTPGYWGFYGGYYRWNGGYWGPHIGFYGGINYGYGYDGDGYHGGRWDHGHFRYNTAITRVNTRVVHNTYVDRSAISNHGSRAGYNGPGGASTRPSAGQMAAAKERHVQPTQRQQSHQRAASKNQNERMSVNKGHPGSTATRGNTSTHTAAPRTSATSGHTANRPAAHHASPSHTTAPSHSAARSSANHRPSGAPHQARSSAPRHQARSSSPQRTHYSPQRQMSRPAPQQRPSMGGGRPSGRQMPQQHMPAGNPGGGGTP